MRAQLLSVVKTYELRCDVCQESLGEARSDIGGIREAAKKRGWARPRLGSPAPASSRLVDLCPTCQRRLIEGTLFAETPRPKMLPDEQGGWQPAIEPDWGSDPG